MKQRRVIARKMWTRRIWPMRPACLALAATSAGFASLLTTAGAEQTSVTVPAVSEPLVTATTANEPVGSTAMAAASIPQLPELTYDTSPPGTGTVIVAARMAADPASRNGLRAGALPVLIGSAQAAQERAMQDRVMPARTPQDQSDTQWPAQLRYSYLAVGGTSGAVNVCCDAADSWLIDRQIMALQPDGAYHFK